MLFFLIVGVYYESRDRTDMNMQVKRYAQNFLSKFLLPVSLMKLDIRAVLQPSENHRFGYRKQSSGMRLRLSQIYMSNGHT